MTKPTPDMLQDEHDDDSGTKKSLLYGTDTGSNILPVLLDDDGQVKIEQVDKLHIGTDTDYTEIKDDGEINLHGAARITRHWLIDPTRFKLPSENYPAIEISDRFVSLNFDKNTQESGYLQEHIPFRLESGTQISVEVDWRFEGADAGAVRWGITYEILKPGDVVGASSASIHKTSDGSHTAGQLVRTSFVETIDTSGADPDSIIGIIFFRDAVNETDTLAQDAKMLNVHFHFTQDKLGNPT